MAQELVYLGTADNIIINGGRIIARGGVHGPGIGGGANINNLSSLKILGGSVYATGGAYGKPYYNDYAAAIGAGIKNIIIEGGTITTDSKAYAGIFGSQDNNVIITGGNLKLGGVGEIGVLDSNKEFVQGFAKNNESKVYKTQLKLQDVGENTKIENITTSDNISYGIKDMNTMEDGMLYLYLPLGKREITIKVKGKTYKGEVETTEEEHNTILNEI